MKYSTDLYDLIQSLSQAEKRYVKLFAQAFSSKGTDTQIALFDAFAAQKTYNEDAIRRQLADRIAAANFHVAKNRLYHLILRALYLFHSSQSEQEKINQLIFQANLLRKRGLYKQSEDLLEKATEIATAIESFVHIPQIENVQTKIIMQRRDLPAIREYLDRSLDAERAAIERYSYEMSMQYLEMQLFAHTHATPTARSAAQLQAIQAMREHPHLQDEEKARSVSKRALWYYRFLNGFIYRYEGNYAKAAEYWAGFVEDVENDPKAINERTLDFISDLNNLMCLQLEAQQYEQADNTCKKLTALLQHDNVRQDPYVTMKVQERITEFRLAYYLRTQQFAEGMQYWRESVEPHWLADWSARVGNLRRLSIDFSAACLYLAEGDAAAAAEWLERTWTNKALKDHDYLYSSVQLLNLIIHFELRNFQLLESLVMNTYRNLYKRKLLYGTERIVFKYLRIYLRSISNKELVSSFRQLYDELQALKDEQFEHILLDNFSLTAWIQSQIEGKKMTDLFLPSAQRSAQS